ncbi:hypothetical protein BDY19DRAFT_919643 [Irpex rosettiformis]|uniref:Uncharacterized protein n=1 Tax=Irpex rosettiformis TaxID=378272 RepID=A0ACB8UIJ7_9APHY|nr:hypothetical protein BDY19DRAFT_919643 [Irpex rosettiformis]
MSERLASFKGPSTPAPSPSKAKQVKIPRQPQSPARPTESTYHRKLRTLLQELRAVTENWDEIVLVDGLKAAKSLVDARTDLDNDLSTVPAGIQPKYRLVQPKLDLMEARIAQLDIVIQNLKRQFNKMHLIIENIERLLYDAHKTRGWQFVLEPLWATWSLEKFATSIPTILVPYHRSLEMHKDIVDTLRSHSVSFETSREAVTNWVSQPQLQEGSWDAHWEDLCDVEIERWNSAK